MEEMNVNGGAVAEEQSAETGAASEARTYTQEEVNQLLQREADKRVTAALRTQQRKHEKQLSLSRLDGEERARAERDERIAELEEQLEQFTIERNRSELKSVLAARGLSAEFADIINISDDIEDSQANIDKLDKLFKAAVKAEVERRIAGNSPKGNTAAAAAEITREAAQKMSLSELSTLLSQNPDLYNELFK